jgi:outer membrane protein assembly factor BamC
VGNSDHTVWQPRASEPDKEAEMLKRLLVKFGVDLPEAAQAVVAAKVEPRAASASASDVAAAAAPAASAGGAASFDTGAAGEPRLKLADSFDRAWRRVGLAIDKSGLALQDQDRDQGLYFVQYSADKVKDPSAGPGKEKKGIGGILSSLGRSIWKKITDTDTSTPAKDQPVDLTPAKDLADIKVPEGVYRVAVSRESGEQSHVTVFDKDGKAPGADVARKVLTVLANEFR